jgi:aspartate racemase
MHMGLEKSTRKPSLSSIRQNDLKRVGILGGMGPAATVDLMAKVLAATPASRDEEHVPLVVWSIPQVPSRPAAMRGEGPSPLPAMLEGARFLESAGATAVAVACNTAHHWADELQRGIRIPLLHIADATIRELLQRRPPACTVGLLGTRATLEAGIYQDRLASRGISSLEPDEATQSAIDRAIEHVKAGELERACTEFVPAAQALLDGGADALVLACTELPLVDCPESMRPRLVDPTLALARAIVAHARGAPCEVPGPDVS